MPEEREVLEVDVLIVGAGPAGLSAAYQLRKLLNESGREDASIAVLEKGKEVGAHIISGAVLDPRGIDELMPDWKEKGAPIEKPVEEDYVYYFTRKGKFSLPIIPPPLQNHGNYIISLNKFVRWFGEVVEESGVDIFAGFSGSELLIEDGAVVGVRTGDKGVDKRGRKKRTTNRVSTFGRSWTILAEGARGSLTKQLINKFNLDQGRNAQVYTIGVKEVWDVPSQRSQKGRVIHTMGWPLTSEEFGGGFIYNMADGRVSLGLVIGLDYRNPTLDPHARFQRYKEHPFVRGMLEAEAWFPTAPRRSRRVVTGRCRSTTSREA